MVGDSQNYRFPAWTVGELRAQLDAEEVPDDYPIRVLVATGPGEGDFETQVVTNAGVDYDPDPADDTASFDRARAVWFAIDADYPDRRRRRLKSV